MSEIPTQAYIDGQWVNSSSGATFDIENPATQEVFAKAADCTPQDVQLAVDAASRAFQTYRQTTVTERVALLKRITKTLAAHKEDISALLTKEQGKPLNGSRWEVEFSVDFMQWFVEEARRHYGETIPSPVASKRLMTIRQPAGVAALLLPWNFPVAMIARKLGAALAAGCTCVIKPAEDTTVTTLYVLKVLEKAGIPKGVVNCVVCSRDSVAKVGKALCDHPDVRVMSFTGSTEVGQILYKQCGDTMKKIHLELGGDAPFIVFPTGNVSSAVDYTMQNKFRNAGQTCVCANKILIHKTLANQYVSELKKELAKIKLGNGMDKDVTMGPLVNERQHKRAIKLVKDSIAMGAKVEIGGKPGKGLYYEPTILTNVTPDMPIAREENFCPVAAVMTFDTEDEAMKIASNTKKGLAGFFFTNDLNQSVRVAERMETGLVGVNVAIVSTPEAPFGGVKYSGFGKEGSRFALDEFTNLKYICIGGLE